MGVGRLLGRLACDHVSSNHAVPIMYLHYVQLHIAQLTCGATGALPFSICYFRERQNAVCKSLAGVDSSKCLGIEM